MTLVYVQQKKSHKRKNSNSTKAKRDLKAEWEKMLKKFGGDPSERINKFSLPPLRSTGLERILALHRERDLTHFPSAPITVDPRTPPPPKYKGAMLEREIRAQEEIAHKKTQVAPIYNKGPAAYIAGYDPKDIGRK